MWAKVAAEVIKTLLLNFAAWAAKAVKRMIARRKRVKQTQEAAREVENAKTPDDIRDAADDLP